MEITTADAREYLRKSVGREVDLNTIRRDLLIKPEDKSWESIRNIMYQLAQLSGEKRIIKPSGKRDGSYYVIPPVRRIKVFGVKREKIPPFELMYPRDFDTFEEFEFSSKVIVREGDCILVAGQSNYGKTAIALNFAGENIDKLPVLMGNEYSKDGEPTPRFLNRLEAMDWIQWANGDGGDKFELLPVYDDYADWIIKDRINIIDWVNIDANYLYSIGKVMEDIKAAVGKGIVIIVIQKSEGSDSGRGGQFTKDFADLELLIDKHSDWESRLTIGKVKEYNGHVVGRSWAYTIDKGVKLLNVREVIKCKSCHGSGRKGGNMCELCHGNKYVDL
uniref:Putative DNA primase n=1 Tax=viral metagenome TaxID=1070528 RepID=A0A6M3J821_9ZZZZ